MDSQQIKIEWLKCSFSFAYFVNNYGEIYDASEKEWVDFLLWPEQEIVADILTEFDLHAILKARQLGMTWLVLFFALWLMLFHPIATILLFSRRDTEAVYLLKDRLKEMYKRLPEWMQCRAVLIDNDHEWQLSNGSVARAFPTSAGDSYTATLAIVDEADLVPDLNRLMRAVKPTIDNGGKMILLSRSDKSRPNSEFKNIYRAAKAKKSPWHASFLPWYVHPDRDEKWYEEQKQDILTRTTALDDLYEQYPATDTEALSAKILDKRLSPLWVESCKVEQESLPEWEGPAVTSLEIYQLPQPLVEYIIGADPAEGNPNSDDSAITVLRTDTAEEVARVRAKLQPSVMASHIDLLSTFYNKASVLVERNNHGHAVILWLEDNSMCYIIRGLDGKPGWMSSSKGKSLMYNTGADYFRDKRTTIHSEDTASQLMSIEGSTLRAPEGLPDDLADSYVLALVGIEYDNVAMVGESPTHNYRG